MRAQKDITVRMAVQSILGRTNRVPIITSILWIESTVAIGGVLTASFCGPHYQHIHA